MSGAAPDPFLLEVFRYGLDTIADQMAVSLMRSAYSGIVRDSMDFSTAVCDAKGRTLAQGLTVPLHLGSFPDAMRNLIARHRDEMAPDDVFIFNDPYAAAGQHLPDIYIIRPVFLAEQLIAFATTIAHHADVGGIVPGSNSLGAHEIFQEGLRLPILKLVDRGRLVQPVWDIIGLNVRLPEIVLGDLQAQIAATTTGEAQVRELWERMGRDVAVVYAEHLHDYAEHLARSEIAAMRDGIYRFTDQIEGIGEDPEPIVLQLALTIKDTAVTVDWTGSSPQVAGGINSVLPFTKSAAFTALRSVMHAEIPNCEGYTRPIDVVAPAGTVMNPLPPGACGGRGVTGYRMIDCLMGALAQAVPDRVTADGNGGSALPTIAGVHLGRPFIFCETFMGTWGATAGHDGQEGVPHLGANQANVSVETIEADYPLRIERYEMVPNTAGPGRFAGGCALRREYRLLADKALLLIRSDKRRFPPHGLDGGGTGQPSLNLINPGPRQRVLPVMLTEPVEMRANDLFVHVTASGGGYGDPLERSPDRVVRDIVQGRIDREHASAAYGVAVTGEATPRVDTAATDAARGRMRQHRSSEHAEAPSTANSQG
jgi:N-methylhydantoinase B